MEQSNPVLFAASVLMLLVRRPLTGPLVALRGRLLRVALAAGRGLARALFLLRRPMLLSCAALTATLAAGRGLFGALLMLRRSLVLGCAATLTATLAAGRGLTCALVLLRGRLLRTCATLAGR